MDGPGHDINDFAGDGDLAGHLGQALDGDGLRGDGAAHDLLILLFFTRLGRGQVFRHGGGQLLPRLLLGPQTLHPLHALFNVFDQAQMHRRLDLKDIIQHHGQLLLHLLVVHVFQAQLIRHFQDQRVVFTDPFQVFHPGRDAWQLILQHVVKDRGIFRRVCHELLPQGGGHHPQGHLHLWEGALQNLSDPIKGSLFHQHIRMKKEKSPVPALVILDVLQLQFVLQFRQLLEYDIEKVIPGHVSICFPFPGPDEFESVT